MVALTLLLAPADAAAASRPDDPGRVVVVGIPDLVWADITPAGTPALWGLVQRGSVGALSVRAAVSRTCPGDGWLTLGAGNRASDGNGVGQCVPPAQSAVLAPPGSVAGPAVVPSTAEARRINQRLHFDTDVGVLGDTLAAAGECVAAVGPGAALAAADPTGKVAAYSHSVDLAPSGFFSRCAATLVAVDDVVDFAGERPARLKRTDDQVATVLDKAGADVTVLVAGLSEVGSARPRLHVAIAAGPAPHGARYEGGTLTGSPQTSPYVQLIDVAPTILALLDRKQPAAVVGQPWRPIPNQDSAAERVDGLVDLAVAAQAHRRLVPAFFILLVALQMLLYVVAAVVLRRNSTGPGRWRLRRVTTWLALAFASIPAASFLANLVPWWRADRPLLAVVAAIVAIDAAIVVAAVRGPWRRSLLGPITLVAGVTALALAVDVMTGSRLQMFSLAGYSALVAGRFYGLGNVAFALFATAALLATAGVADALKSRKRVATVVVVLLGVTAVAVDGAPSWGADFGGVLALVPGVAVLVLAAAGKRFTFGRFVLVVVAAAGLVTAFATLDYLRPAAERTHLGRFVGQVLDGGAWTVIERKASANLSLLTTTPLALIVPVALAFLALVLLRPTSTGAGALSRVFDDAPMLRPGLIAVLVTAAIGFLTNDSGVVVPAMAMTLAVPLALAVSLRALEGDAATGDELAGVDLAKTVPRSDPATSFGGPDLLP